MNWSNVIKTKTSGKLPEVFLLQRFGMVFDDFDRPAVYNQAGLVTASGMGAITATIWTMINGGEEI